MKTERKFTYDNEKEQKRVEKQRVGKEVNQRVIALPFSLDWRVGFSWPLSGNGNERWTSGSDPRSDPSCTLCWEPRGVREVIASLELVVQTSLTRIRVARYCGIATPQEENEWP